jgi:GNAT superfamily N-acetyltransferase
MAIDTQFVPFLFDQSPENEWETLIDLRMASFREVNFDEPVPPREYLRKGIEQFAQIPQFVAEMYRIVVDGQTVGLLISGSSRPGSPDYEAQKEMAIADIFILPEFRRRGFGREALQQVVNHMRREGLTLLQASTQTDAGRAFSERYGVQRVLETRLSRLLLDQVDHDQLLRMRDDAISHQPGVRIETYEGLPDVDLEVYAALYTEVMNQQPMGETENLESTITPEILRTEFEQEQARGDIRLTKITREADGAISGLTEVLYNPQRPQRVAQMITGVQERYRGRKLGKALKADMLLEVRQRWSEAQFITTGNADSNAAMLAINQQLGFELYRHNTVLKITLADLEQALAASH